MAQPHLTARLDRTEEAIIVPFCLLDDAYRFLNPCCERYASLERLSDSEVLAPAPFQQSRGLESERSFLREAERFFSHPFPGVPWGSVAVLARSPPPSRKLRRFLEPLRRAVLADLWWRAADPHRRLYAA